MSTFNGFVPEFPYIRIDQFRKLPDRPPALACFLSHVHSDHLLGLDSLRGTFVYCSPATREMLLKLEKYPHRINFNKGIAEVVRRDYRHLKRLLRPIQLDTPTRIDLTPGISITVTLFSANHCLGAVSFLIEDGDKAILYTGDIRAEAWLLDSWARHPKLLPYVPSPRGPGIRRLSTVYLDTTFVVSSHMFAKFVTKAQGLSELYTSLQRYPCDTLFYMHAWTFGYEEVWSALSHILQSQIHLDRYRCSVYTSISNTTAPGLESREAPVLCGSMVGNTHQPGILTRDCTARVHSCERGSGCPVVDGKAGRAVVRIKPVVSRIKGADVDEVGLGGGKGDLDQMHRLDLGDRQAVVQLQRLCERHIPNEAKRARVIALLEEHSKNNRSELDLTADLVSKAIDEKHGEDLKLVDLVNVLAELASPTDARDDNSIPSAIRSTDDGSLLPMEITFPYSRHSSYDEARHLVSLFCPTNVFPCTAPPPEDFSEDKSMETLFGDCCQGQGFMKGLNGPPVFTWDQSMREACADLERAGLAKSKTVGDQETQMEDDDSTSDEDGEGGTSELFKQTTARGADPPSRPAPARSPRSSTDSSSSIEGRLRARKLAYDAAVSGEWHRIRLACTGRDATGTMYDDDEGEGGL